MKNKSLITLLSAFILSGCGGYYTKDVYFKDSGSEKWKTAFGDSRISKFRCGNEEISLSPTTLKSKKTAEGIFGIPVWPANKELKDIEIKKRIIISLSYKAKNIICNKNDISLRTDSELIKTATIESIFNNETQAYCNYFFNTDPTEIEKVKIVFAKNLLSCSIPPLKLVKDSGYNYNFSPW